MLSDSPQKPRTARRLPYVAVTTIAAAALGVGAIGAVSLGAAFTDQAQVDGQQVATATVDIEAGVVRTAAPLDATNLLPGDTVATAIEIRNAGSADVYYTLSALLPEPDPLTDALNLQITVGGVTETRSLSSWTTGALQIAVPLASGATAHAQVSVTLPYGAPDSLQRAATAFSVVVEAIQAQNTPAPTAGWASR